MLRCWGRVGGCGCEAIRGAPQPLSIRRTVAFPVPGTPALPTPLRGTQTHP